MLLKLFLKAEPFLYQQYLNLRYRATPNVRGDRDIEYSFICANMPDPPKNETCCALDFGCGVSYMALIAARKGYDTLAIDLLNPGWFYEHNKLLFTALDITHYDRAEASQNLDLVINCSTVEHVGLAGRYSVTAQDDNGDLKAMAILYSAMKPGAIMLLTIPVGQDAVFKPTHRVYGKQRLPLLLGQFNVLKEEYWVKTIDNIWREGTRQQALSQQTSTSYYATGCFVLQKPS